MFSLFHGRQMLSFRRWTSSSAAPAHRPRVVRPRFERLEGRIVQATSALDPTFGQGGLVVGLLSNGSGNNVDQASAVAVGVDGKIVVAGTSGSAGSNTTLAVRRYNTDGSLDTTFGTAGETDVPLPYAGNLVIGPTNLVIKADGTVVLAATNIGNTPLISNSILAPTVGLVAQLTPSGQLDSNFGTNGEFILPGTLDALNTIAMQPDGKIVAAGRHVSLDSSGSGTYQLLAIRLNATGTLDTSFNGTGELNIAVPGSSVETPVGYPSVGDPIIALAPSGQIYLGANITGDLGVNLMRVNSGGTLDTSYGASGFLKLAPSLAHTLNSIVVQTDGKLVAAGTIDGISSLFGNSNRLSSPFLVRLMPDGTADTSFAGIPISLASTQFGPHGGFTSIALDTSGEITVAGYGFKPKMLGQLLVARYNASGRADLSFGLSGRMTFSPPAPAGITYNAGVREKVALTPANKVVFLGLVISTSAITGGSQPSLLAQLVPSLVLNNGTNDFDGDGKSDIAAELTSLSYHAYRKSNGTGDVVQQFGRTGFGASIPAPGDYDGDGKTDVAVYLPALGTLAYRPSSGGDDVLDAFGPAGTGASIPASGDYDGDGQTDVAVYLPASGSFAIQLTAGAGNVLAPFGVKGTESSIPAPGDYDGDGITDLAVYIPGQGILAYRPSSGGADVKISFGSAGAGASIPAPGDYDGDGKTDVAVYLPASGSYAIHPSSNAANYLIPFGMKGAYNSVPAPGDYDGDGKTDAAVYLPTLGQYAYRPSSGGSDVVQGFGQAGYNATVPVASIPYAFSSSTGSTGARSTGTATPSAVVYIPLTDDVTSSLTNSTRSKRRVSSSLGLKQA